MRITFCSQKRYEKNFKPLKIDIYKNYSQKSQVYNILNEKNVCIGQFSFSKETQNGACIADLNFNNNLRGSKSSANALISMKNFILDKAKNENLDYIYFYADEYNKYNVVKLYKKLFPEIFCKKVDFNKFEFLLPITPKGQIIVAELLENSKGIKIPDAKEIIKNIEKIKPSKTKFSL